MIAVALFVGGIRYYSRSGVTHDRYSLFMALALDSHDTLSGFSCLSHGRRFLNLRIEIGLEMYFQVSVGVQGLGATVRSGKVLYKLLSCSCCFQPHRYSQHNPDEKVV